MSDEPINIKKEIDEANERLPIVVDSRMPLDITIRSIALTVAQRHCGDQTVKEGNLYQQLKMDNKLGGPLGVDHVLSAALIFERYLWGEWSKGIAGEAATKAIEEVEEAMRREFKDDEPIRPHGGGEGTLP